MQENLDSNLNVRVNKTISKKAAIYAAKRGTTVSTYVRKLLDRLAKNGEKS